MACAGEAPMAARSGVDLARGTPRREMERPFLDGRYVGVLPVFLADRRKAKRAELLERAPARVLQPRQAGARQGAGQHAEGLMETIEGLDVHAPSVPLDPAAAAPPCVRGAASPSIHP